MKPLWRHTARLFLGAMLLLTAACGPAPLGTHTMEERFMGEGYANQLFDYGLQLFKEGRLRESHTAFYECEGSAYTAVLRQKARTYRIYLERVIAAREKGAEPPPPPPDPDKKPDAKKPGEEKAAVPAPPEPQKIGVERR
jgi:hypothetical protein